jgi:hypothetical protein
MRMTQICGKHPSGSSGGIDIAIRRCVVRLPLLRRQKCDPQDATNPRHCLSISGEKCGPALFWRANSMRVQPARVRPEAT